MRCRVPCDLSSENSSPSIPSSPPEGRKRPGVPSHPGAFPAPRSAFPAPRGAFPAPPLSVEPVPAPDPAPRFYKDNIVPEIEAAAKANLAAVDRALGRIDGEFLRARCGITPFCADLTTWGTRFGVAGRKIGELWRRYIRRRKYVEKVAPYVNAKFRKHVLSESQLEKAVTECIQQFQSDLEANRNRLLSRVHGKLRAADAPVSIRLDAVSLDQFQNQVRADLQSMLTDMGEKSVIAMVLGEFGGELAAYAITKLVLKGVAYVVGRVVIVRCTTATGGAIGGTSGSAAGPAGTIIGIGVGVAVGCVVDWWMTKRFKRQVRGQVTAWLDTVEKTLVDGTEGTGGKEGLRSVLKRAAETHNRQLRSVIERQVFKGKE